MDLLDQDSKIMEESAKSKTPKTRRKAGLAGLNRFKGLTDAYRNSEKASETTTETVSSNDSNTNVEVSEPIPPATEVSVSRKVEVTPVPEEKVETVKPKPQDLEIKKEVPVKVEITRDNNRDNTVKYSDNNQVTRGNNPDNNWITPDNQRDNNTDNKKNPDNKINPPSPEVFTSEANEGIGIVIYDYKTLSGNEKNLLGIIFHECLREGSLETDKIPMTALSSKLNVSLGTAKMTTHRLKKKGMIESIDAKRTKGGWSRYRISKDLYQSLQNDQTFFNFEPNRITNRITKEITKSPSSSSNFLNKNTNTTNDDLVIWNVIQIPNNVKDIGFSMAHVKQVARDGQLTVDDLQNSLDAFSFDLQENKVKAITGPLRLLMGVLRRQKVPYVSEALIECEKREMEVYMQKRKEIEEARKLAKEMELMNRFDQWWSGLSQEERNKVVKPSNFIPEASEMQEKLARGNFLENPGIADLVFN